MKSLARQALHWTGSSVAFLGIAFVAMRLKGYVGSNVISHMTPLTWAVMGVFAVFYGVANLLLASAWRHLLIQWEVNATWHWSIKTYGVSQLAKYVPGNFFHLAGRQGLGMAAGIPAGVLAKSSIYELGSIALAGSMYGWIVLSLIIHGFPLLLSTIVFLLSIYIINHLLHRFFGRDMARCFCQHVLFLFISGLIFSLLTIIVSHSGGTSPKVFVLIISSYVVAWLAGLVTPGAPAGVGVREWILLFLLRDYITEADLILVILLGRAITVAGDLLFFFASLMISSYKIKNGGRNAH